MAKKVLSEANIKHYRGAIIISYGKQARLNMKGHPYHGMVLKRADAWFALIDHWLAHLPDPGVAFAVQHHLQLGGKSSAKYSL